MFRTSQRNQYRQQAKIRNSASPESPGGLPNPLAADSVIAEITTMFSNQAKAENKNTVPSQTDNNNQNNDVLQLLAKISSQLENMQKNEGQNTTPATATNNQQPNYSTDQQPDPQSAPKLQALLNQLLPNGNQGQAGETNSQPPNSAGSGTQSGQLNPQDAAQALANAQLELSQELEASLKKLKQVIAESEKLANKISNILNTENQDDTTN